MSKLVSSFRAFRAFRCFCFRDSAGWLFPLSLDIVVAEGSDWDRGKFHSSVVLTFDMRTVNGG